MAFELAFFDLGGVVVEVESDRMVHQIAAQLGRPFEEVHAAVYDKDLLLPFEIGKITPQQYYQGLMARLKLPWTYEQFVRVWTGIFAENQEVTGLLRDLRKRHRLIALSNTNTLHLEYIRANFPSLSVFEHWIGSCDVGLRKPDPKIYVHALEHAGVRPSAVVYVDDRPEMVEAGRGAGLTAIRFLNAVQLREDLRAAGLDI